jgi:hypothetical protein
MTDSLRALLAGAIDYAGMFPPAGLSLEQALAKYRQHRSGPEAWMVGRFVCPAGQLKDLERLWSGGGVTVSVPGPDAGKPFPTLLDEVLNTARNSRARSDIDMIECRWPIELFRPAYPGMLPVILRTAVGQVAATKLVPLALFFEYPFPKPALWNSSWSSLVCALGDYKENTGADYCSAGFKLRCGGATAGEIPPVAAVATVISSCRDTGIFWKATAGLHHPFRHVDPALRVPMHGFINLLTAAVMADVHRLDTERIQTILEDDDPAHFRFTNEALTWRDLSATVPQIAGARERALRSFGSCSVDEPWQDLTVLGLL